MIMLTGPIGDDEAEIVRAALTESVWLGDPQELILELAAGVILDDVLVDSVVAASAIAAARNANLRIRCGASGLANLLASRGLRRVTVTGSSDVDDPTDECAG